MEKVSKDKKSKGEGFEAHKESGAHKEAGE